MSEFMLKMRPSNYGHAVAIVREAMGDMQAERAAQSFGDHESYDQRHAWVLRIDKADVGLGGYYIDRYCEGLAWLSYFAVRPQCQGNGYGGGILRYVEGRCVKLGFTRMLIETYTSEQYRPAVAFYHRNGYTVKGSLADYMPDGSTILYLGKDLEVTE